MKKTKTVKIPAKKAVEAKPAKIKEVTETVCDFCGASVPDHGSYGWYPSCQGCGRDCCRKHNFPENDWSDYPTWYCSICRALRKQYEPEYEKIAAEFEKATEKLDKKLRKESLEKEQSS